MENTKTQKNINFTQGELLLLHQLLYAEIKYNEYVEEKTDRPLSQYQKRIYNNLFKKLDKILYSNIMD